MFTTWGTGGSGTAHTLPLSPLFSGHTGPDQLSREGRKMNEYKTMGDIF